MRELLASPPQLKAIYKNNMLHQERISKSINLIACMVYEFDELGEHNPYAESIQIIKEQLVMMEKTSVNIKTRISIIERDSDEDYRYDIRYDGSETYMPNLRYKEIEIEDE
jgi:hypothetical protein